MAEKRLLLMTLLAGATLALYWPVTGFEFVNLDDQSYVVRNPHVTGGLTRQGLAWAFTSAGYEGNWHPLTWLSHMVDVELFGLRPGLHHLTNLALHAANAALLFGLLLRMTSALWKSAFVAAVFAVHPLHVESVAWVAERKDVLSTFFWILTLAAYLRYAENRSRIRYCLVFVSLALGLMAKPMVMTLPLVLLLLDYWPLGIPLRLKEKIPLLALSLASGIVTLVAQGQSVQSLEIFPLTTRAANAVVAYTSYVVKALWPGKLAVFYPYHADGLTAWPVLGAVLFLATITFMVLRPLRKYPYLGVGWCFFLVTLFPAIGIVQVGVQALADRYTYVPLIGLAVMAAWGAPVLAGRWRCRRWLVVLSGAAIVALAIPARHQIASWLNGETLMTHALAVTQGNWLAHHNLGVVYLEQGRYAKAVTQLEEALAIKPDYTTAHLNLGNVFSAMGRFPDAEREYRRAIQLRPDTVEAYNNLGKLYLDQNRPDEAHVWFQRALQRKPDFAEAHYNAGIAFQERGEREQAIAEYRAALRLKPDFLEPHINLGNALDEAGRFPEAIEQYRKAIDLRPTSSLAHYNLALTLDQGGAREEAIPHYREALRLDPDLVQARFRLENALRRR
jgi:tetratricopeptide (TPR) repeat protein